MLNLLNVKLLQSILQKDGYANIFVTGTSMEPTFFDGQQITVQKQISYEVGEVIVFEYKQDLVVHRILYSNKNQYYCKGDNSFKIEDIDRSQILGKAMFLNCKDVPVFTNDLIELAIKVNILYRKHSYDIEPVLLSDTYKKYKNLLLELNKKI